MRSKSKLYSTLVAKSDENAESLVRFQRLAQIHREVLEAVGSEAAPRRRPQRPKTQLFYPDLPDNLPLRLHFQSKGSLLRERAASLSKYAELTKQQTAETGETFMSVAMSSERVWLYERLIETLGGSGLPFGKNGGFDTLEQGEGPMRLTEAASRMARDNNLAGTYTWQFERIHRAEYSPPLPKDKPKIPDDLPWDPDPDFQRVLDLTQRGDLESALVVVETFDPSRREIVFDEVLYLKYCLKKQIGAQDIRYIIRKYVNDSTIAARLTDEFDAFLSIIDSFLVDDKFFEKVSYPWDQLVSWSEFKDTAYHNFKAFGHPSWPRGRIFVWHPDFYMRSTNYIDSTFKSAFVDAENQFRRERDIPAIGRGWASEAALFDLIRSRFPDAIFQWSPSWLGRQSADIYVPSINVAWEYQGEQHYRPVALFGGEEGFQATLYRDSRKRERFARQGIRLLEWRFDTPITSFALDRLLLSLDK
jgi:hypothetical protein